MSATPKPRLARPLDSPLESCNSWCTWTSDRQARATRFHRSCKEALHSGVRPAMGLEALELELELEVWELEVLGLEVLELEVLELGLARDPFEVGSQRPGRRCQRGRIRPLTSQISQSPQRPRRHPNCF